jgi:hypothetical protein
MATTGFWPVKSRLKEVIDYAENPDKTIDKKYVDSDLYAALQYAADDNKTDERMYILAPKVDIYFTAVGMIDIPTEQEILAMMEEIRANPQEFRFVA